MCDLQKFFWIASYDDAHIEWLGGSNDGKFRISTSDDTGTEYIQFGDYDLLDRTGTFTEWLRISRSTGTKYKVQV